MDNLNQPVIADYSEALRPLFSLGNANPSVGDWPDYLALGLQAQHTQELLRLALNMQLHLSKSESLEGWAPVHAWRALAQLQATEALPSLVQLLRDQPHDEWIREEMPAVISRFGTAAYPVLLDALQQADWPVTSHCSVAQCFSDLALDHPELRAGVVAALVRKLENPHLHDRELNGYFIWSLLDLEALEAAPIIEQLFADGLVDLDVVGDWDDVQVALGLKEPPPPKQPLQFKQPLIRTKPPVDDFPQSGPSRSQRREKLEEPGQPRLRSDKQKAKAKARQQMAKQSRKRNRKQ